MAKKKKAAKAPAAPQAPKAEDVEAELGLAAPEPQEDPALADAMAALEAVKDLESDLLMARELVANLESERDELAAKLAKCEARCKALEAGKRPAKAAAPVVKPKVGDRVVMNRGAHHGYVKEVSATTARVKLDGLAMVGGKLVSEVTAPFGAMSVCRKS